jgi:iron complex outermembrane receptor protein
MQNTSVVMAQLAMTYGNTDIWMKYRQTKWDDGWGNSVRISPLTTTTNNPCNPTAASGNACASLVNSGSLGPSSVYNSGTGYFRPAPGAALIPIPMAPANPPYTTPNPGVANHRQVNHDTPGHEVLDPSHQVVVEVVSHFDSFDVKYLGGYYSYVYKLRTDYDNSNRKSYRYTPIIGAAGALDIFTQVDQLYVEDKTYFSNELNITSTSDSPLQWIFGLYQFHEEYEQPVTIGPRNQPQYLTPVYSPGPPAIPAPANPVGANYYTDAHIKTNSKAVYGQIDWDFAEKWSMTLGLRYTEDEKFGDEFSRLIFWDPGTFGSFTPAVDITPSQLGSRATPVGNGFYTRHLENEWSATTGTAGISWKPTDDTMTYLKYTRGYKDGGMNPGAIVEFPYTDPEFANAYEIGLKQSWDRFQANVSAFYYDVKDSQIPLTIVRGPGLPNLTQTFNIDGESLGIEVETIWQPIDALQILLNYAYLDATLKDPGGCFQDALDRISVGPRPCVTPTGGAGQLIDGNRIPGSPENKLAVSLMYTFEFAPGSLTIAPSYFWRDDTYSSIFTRDEWKADAYGQLDGRIVWNDARDRFTLIGYVRNALDDEGFNGVDATASGDGISQSYSLTPPRQYGMEVQFRFGK